MNIYILSVLSKWLSVALISLASIGNITPKELVYDGNNAYATSKQVISPIVEKYEVVNKYSSKRPLGIAYTLMKGINGYKYIDNATSKEIIIQNKRNEVVEIGTGEIGEYTGRLTGYGPDCPGCSLVGNVACFTYEKKKHSLITDGIFYKDREYGGVHILAAALTKFPCGTIVYVNNGILKPFYGIVLDTGGAMRGALKENVVWMDLAYPSEKISFTAGATSRNTKFSVIRWGW